MVTRGDDLDDDYVRDDLVALSDGGSDNDDVDEADEAEEAKEVLVADKVVLLVAEAKDGEDTGGDTGTKVSS